MRERGLAAVVVAIAACYDPSPPLNVPCNDKGECPDGQQCDPVMNVCTLPTELVDMRDDTAEDFAAGAYLDEVTVEPQGFLGPLGFFAGGVRVSGIASNAIANLDTVTFADLGTDRTRSAIVYGFPNYGTEAPIGLDLGAGVGITIVVEFEVQLDVDGTWGFELTANDLGFLEIAPPGSSTFERLVQSTNAKAGTTTFQAPVAGWYRMRGAFVKTGGATNMRLRFDPPNQQGNFKDIPLERLRARVGDLAGLELDGFEQAFLLGPRGSVLFDSTLARTMFDPNPFGLTIGGATYTLRFVGQFLVDVDGDYTFKLDTTDGHRAWIDGSEVADVMVTTPMVTITQPQHLVAGWHDLVIDLQKDSTGSELASLAFTVDSGPALAGDTFPLDHLRPVPGRVARWAGSQDESALAIPDGASVSRGLSFELPSGPIAAQRVDVSFEIDHPTQAQVGVVANAPAGGPVTLASAGSLTGTGVAYRHRTLSPSNAGANWTFVASDNLVDVVTGSLTYDSVTVIYDGGAQPFSTSYRYQSAVHDLGDVAAYGALTWGVRQGSTDMATLRMRTCEDADGCAAEPFVDVAFGAVPSVPLHRFAQYELAVTTDGDIPTAIDFVDLAYSRYVH